MLSESQLKQYKKFTIIDNDFKRSCVVYSDNKKDAMSNGASQLRTCNIRVYESKPSVKEYNVLRKYNW